MRVWGWAVAGALLLAGLVVFLGGDTWEIADQKAGVIAMFAGLGALALALLHEFRYRRAARQAQPVDLDRIADRLAEAVAAQWQDEERIRRIHDPYPMPVRWTNAPDHLADHWANIRLDPECDDPVDLAGRLDEIGEVFDRVPARRLVVLGKPGAGKTILTTRFVLTRLKNRKPGEPVPVIVPLASWNPGRQTLHSWLADRLVVSYPELATVTETENTTISRLLETKRILPVLDGFDEINPRARDHALREINRSLGADDELLLTSRPDEYERANTVVTGAAAITLADLDVADIGHYLHRATRDKTRDKWEPLLATLEHDAAPALVEVLSTPLMLAMARTNYSDTRADPAELIDLAATDDPHPRLETHLLSRFVPASYGTRDEKSAHGWAPDRAHRWLAFLAHGLDQRGTDDLAWWHIAYLLRHPNRLLGLTAGLAGALMGGSVAGLEGGLVAGLASGLVCGLTVGLSVGLMFRLTGEDSIEARFPNTVDPTLAARRDRRVSLSIMFAVTLPYAVATGLTSALGGVLFGLGVAVFTANSSPWGRYAVVRTAFAATGRLPWALMTFLADAHRRGVLRQVGPVYQFRHARLRDQLAAEYREKYLKQR